VIAGRLRAVVVELGEDRHAVHVYRVGDQPVPGRDGGVPAADDLLVGAVAGVHGVLLGDDHGGATGRASRVVGGMPGGRQPADGVVGQVRGEHDPPAQPPQDP
jgi:hypothetical protein